MYLDVLKERNPPKLAALKASGRLEEVLKEIDDLSTTEELRLTKEIAKESLEGREPNGPQVSYQESVQALNTAAVSAREIVIQQLVELAAAAQPSEPITA